MVPRARNGRYGELGNRTARVPGRWVRWIGWIGVRDAGRDLCGVDHLRHAQPYVPTATENGWAGRGDIHTNAINLFQLAPDPFTVNKNRRRAAAPGHVLVERTALR